MAEIMMSELSSKTALLDKAIYELGKRGRAYAKAEQDYKVALAEKIMEEREKGTPVTIISDLCRGDKKIALLRFERDCAEVVYKAALEAINSYKLQIRILDNQIGREWSNG